VKLRSVDISAPWSQVIDRRSSVGSLAIALRMAASTVTAERPPSRCSSSTRRGALDQRPDRAATALAEDEVAFPVARHRAVLDAGGPLGDVDHPRDPPSTFNGAALLAAGAP